MGVASLKIIQKDPLNPPKGGLTERHRLIGPFHHWTIDPSGRYGMACGQKSVKNPKENLSKIRNKLVLLSKGVICIKIRQIREIRVQEKI